MLATCSLSPARASPRVSSTEPCSTVPELPHGARGRALRTHMAERGGPVKARGGVARNAREVDEEHLKGHVDVRGFSLGLSTVAEEHGPPLPLRMAGRLQGHGRRGV
jgi:hypothetical protein